MTGHIHTQSATPDEIRAGLSLMFSAYRYTVTKQPIEIAWQQNTEALAVARFTEDELRAMVSTLMESLAVAAATLEIIPHFLGGIITEAEMRQLFTERKPMLDRTRID